MPSSVRVRIAILWSILLLAAVPEGVSAQRSERMGEFLLFGRGSALGSQGLAGDLLAARIDPTVAAGEGIAVELANGTHELDLAWTAAGVRFQAFGRPLAIVVATLDYGEQQRTTIEDRLGLFAGTFSPGDASLTAATVLLEEPGTVVGAGATITFARLDDARATLLTAALSGRRDFGAVQLRASLAGLGTAISTFGGADGTALPVRLRMGGGWAAREDLELSAESLWRAGDDTWSWSLGAEWLPVPQLALRLGSALGDGADRLADGGLADLGLTAGIGWRIGDWHLAYVHRPGGRLGDGHAVALSWTSYP